MSRLQDLVRFYDLLSRLEARCGGKHLLRDCTGRMDWPARGIYFFFEPGETRSDSGTGLRVVRVGTHAVSKGSKATLWQRLSQHRGRHADCGGNHRGSIFRWLVGSALAAREPDLVCANWEEGRSAPKSVRLAEGALEMRVSQYIGAMPFLWIGCEDEASSQSERAYLERNSIALLSNAVTGSGALDPPSPAWLGRLSHKESVRLSGLWNSRHVTGDWDDGFLDRFEHLLFRQN